MWKNLEASGYVEEFRETLLCCPFCLSVSCIQRCLLRWADHIGSGVSCLLSALLLSEFGLRRDRANSPQIGYFCS